MKLDVQQLESRFCPVFLGSRDGFILMPDDQDFTPFPDFMADHAVASNGVVTVVGAASGGGPRVQVREGQNVIADFFAYEDSFRDGVNVALGSGVVVTGAAPGGGPVVAVYDEFGNQMTRFFAYDPAFRGGVSVGVREDRIITVPGPGGGPLVREFDFHGVELDSWFGDDPSRRDGWDLIVGDVTHDHFDDITLATRTGRAAINEGMTGGRQVVSMPKIWTRAGYEGESLSLGNEVDYKRARGLWTSFERLSEFDFADGAAGNPNPPPTTGTRPGIYRPISVVGGPPPGLGEITRLVSESDSVGSGARATGSSFVPMVDEAGNVFLATASHVVRSNPYALLNELPNLVAPGGIDGTPATAGFPVRVSSIVEGVPYSVDAAAFRPAPGVVIDRSVHLADMVVRIDGVARDVQEGDVLMAVGRSKFVGVGTVSEPVQLDPVSIRWPSGATPTTIDQIVAIKGAVQLAHPGFSGGVALRLSWTPAGVARELVGMVVAGNDYYTYLTPVSAIEQSLGLRVSP